MARPLAAQALITAMPIGCAAKSASATCVPARSATAPTSQGRASDSGVNRWLAASTAPDAPGRAA